MARMDGELSCLAIPVVVVVVIGMVGLRVSAMRVVKLGTLLVNAVYVLVLEVRAVEGVAAGAAAAAPDTAGVRAMVEEVTALVIALQDAAVFCQLVSAAIVDHHSTTVPEMILPMPTEVMVPGTVVAGVGPEVRA